jgi:hypothetical protein
MNGHGTTAGRSIEVAGRSIEVGAHHALGHATFAHESLLQHAPTAYGWLCYYNINRTDLLPGARGAGAVTVAWWDGTRGRPHPRTVKLEKEITK